MSELILSPEEIDALTVPVTQHAAQARRLSVMLGCPIKRRPDGLPIVTRAMLARWQRDQDILSRFVTEPDGGMLPAFEDTAIGRYQQRRRESQAQAEADYAAWLAVQPQPTPAERRAAAREAERAAKAKRAALVRFHEAKRRAAQLQRTPSWADFPAMRAIYAEAQRVTAATGIPHHVDHEIPLQGKLVSGLHVHNNLQILTGSENSKKRNHYEVEA